MNTLEPQTTFGDQGVWHTAIPSRRLTSRIERPEDVWILWECDGRDGISCVRNISFGGLCIDHPTPRSQTAVARLHFLVQEGEIRADAIVRHTSPARGVGLKFTQMREADQRKLAALISRLRTMSKSRV